MTGWHLPGLPNHKSSLAGMLAESQARWAYVSEMSAGTLPLF
jgi:hypothetical protein